MQVFNCDNIESQKVDDKGASNVRIRRLITEEIGANNFAMRLFEIFANGYTPLHTHPWEHEVFILEGTGTIFNGEKTTPFKPKDIVFVPPNELHQFKNTSERTLKFLCLIPYSKQ